MKFQPAMTSRPLPPGVVLLGVAGASLALAVAGAAAPADPEAKPVPVAPASPYLEMGSQTAVDWRPWGEEALHEAQEKGLPILLDVGAMWCHYCRVMSEVTYRDEKVAAAIARYFVPVRVDRDQFPHVDSRFQSALLAMRHLGGWPLTAFLTEEGRMFSGATYFPPRDGGDGSPGLLRVLERYGESYQGQKRGYHNTAEETATLLVQQHVTQDVAGPLEGVVEAVAKGILGARDALAGGFGTGAKFPEHPAFGLALELGLEGDAELLSFARRALDGMASGAIHDRLGGGFHRATTDRDWLRPRFEKLLAVNAGLLGLYASAARDTGDPLYREVALGTLDYLLGTLSDRERGGLYAAQAADLGGGDNGSTYTWTLADVQRHLAGEERTVAVTYFRLADPAVAAHPTALGTVVTVEDVALETKLPPERVRKALRAASERLARVRRTRPQPEVDRTLYSSLNGLAARALLRASVLLERPDAAAQALSTLDRFLAEAWSDESGFSRGIRDRIAFGDGILQDQVYLADALVEAYQCTGRRNYLEAARRAIDLAHARFGYAAQPGLHDLPVVGSPTYSMLVIPERPVQDSLEPGANAVAILVDLRIAGLTGDAERRKRAEGLARAFAGSARRYGPNAATFALAVRRLLEPPSTVIVLGAAPATEPLVHEALRAQRNGMLLLHAASVADLPAGLATPELRLALAAAKLPAALVVTPGRLEGPIVEPAALAARLARRPQVRLLEGQGSEGTGPGVPAEARQEKPGTEVGE